MTVMYAGCVSSKNLREMVEFDPEGIFCGSAIAEKVDCPEELREEAKKWLEVIHGAKKPGARPKIVTFGELLLRSSLSELKPVMIDWKKVFEGASWFHWSGITLALSDLCAEALREALKVARRVGITVSVDLNYRKKLWSKEKAQRVMTGLME
jgi:hypothetical protein